MPSNIFRKLAQRSGGRHVNREQIDIEALLIRAYHEKAIDKFGHRDGRAERAWGLILLSGPGGCGGGFSVGDRVQSSSFAEKQAARQSQGWSMLEGCGSGSLIALHDAVLALPTFFYEPLDGLNFQVWDAETATRMGHRIVIGEDGVTIERVRRRGGRDPKRADELRSAGPARRVQAIEATTLLICHGRAANRPDVPDLVVIGRRPVYVGARKQAAGYEAIHETAPDLIVQARAIYATWHACLMMLAAFCADFHDLRVTGPAAPLAPWEDAPAADLGPVARRRSAPRKTGKSDASAMA